MLTDVTITINMVVNDWAISGFSRITEDFYKWTIGEYIYTGQDASAGAKGIGNYDARYIGCNNERMTHVVKGVMGIPMEGAEDMRITNLEIGDLHEYSELGSYAGGEYWDETVTSFTGKGHFLDAAMIDEICATAAPTRHSC